MSIEIARATTRQKSIAPYLDHLRVARLDTDIRQQKGSDEWVDNVRTWVQVISYLAGQNPKYKETKLSKAEEDFADIYLVETAAALSTGAHFPQMRAHILDHASDWHTFIEYVNSKLESDVSKFAK